MTLPLKLWEKICGGDGIIWLNKKYPYRELNPNLRIESPMYYLYTIWVLYAFLFLFNLLFYPLS